MPNLEWTVLHDLVTPQGTITFNKPDVYTSYLWQLIPPYKIVPGMRVTADNISQQDGSVLHPRYKTGLVAQMTVAYVISTNGENAIDAQPACDDDLRIMHEMLGGALNSIRALSANQQRLIWTPSGADRRMLDQIELLDWPDPVIGEFGFQVTFAIETPYGYGVDQSQVTTALADGVPTTIVNPGNSLVQPVFKVYGGGGGVSSFTIVNNSITDEFGNVLEIVYSDALPGADAIPAGQYVEIDTFQGKAFLNGDSTDEIAGFDPTVTDFWYLQTTDISDNDVEIDGADCDVIWNGAWV